MSEPKMKLVVSEDRIYTMTVVFDEEFLTKMFGNPYGRDGLASQIATCFVGEYVKRNFDEIAKLIDMETVKLIATRKLAGVVAENRT